MTATTARIAPLEPPYEPQVAEKLHKLMGRRDDVPPLSLFRTLAVNDELNGRMYPLGSGILGPKSKIEPRVREVVIGRTTALCGSEYEWGVHAAGFAALVGFGEEHLASTVRGSHEDDCWAPDQAAAFRMATELHETSEVSDECFAELRAHFDDEQILELVVTAGWYHVISYVIAACRLENEEWAERFPAR